MDMTEESFIALGDAKVYKNNTVAIFYINQSTTTTTIVTAF
jgi:hypothetical protein